MRDTSSIGTQFAKSHDTQTNHISLLNRRSCHMTRDYDLMVLSHLRWDSVFQRPQQLMSRLCSAHRVFFIEEPVLDGNTQGHWNVINPVPNLFVCQPHTAVPQPGF